MDNKEMARIEPGMMRVITTMLFSKLGPEAMKFVIQEKARDDLTLMRAAVEKLRQIDASSKPKPMQLDSLGAVQEQEWSFGEFVAWNEQGAPEEWAEEEDTYPETPPEQLFAFKGKGKGKGKGGKGKGKGGKGKGASTGGDTGGKGGAENRQCFNCYEWGHIGKDCKKPDRRKGGTGASAKSLTEAEPPAAPPPAPIAGRMCSLPRRQKPVSVFDAESWPKATFPCLGYFLGNSWVQCSSGHISLSNNFQVLATGKEDVVKEPRVKEPREEEVPSQSKRQTRRSKAKEGKARRLEEKTAKPKMRILMSDETNIHTTPTCDVKCETHSFKCEKHAFPPKTKHVLLDKQKSPHGAVTIMTTTAPILSRPSPSSTPKRTGGGEDATAASSTTSSTNTAAISTATSSTSTVNICTTLANAEATAGIGPNMRQTGNPGQIARAVSGPTCANQITRSQNS